MKLRTLSGPELIRILKKVGFSIISQRGSHVKMRKVTEDIRITTIIPRHKEIDTGTLAEIIRQSKMTRDEFLKLLK
jgi:predicted RNA binding protein YcfA (HicA-like mRNA interferase family)